MKMQLRKFLKPIKRISTVVPNNSYKQLGVRVKGRGTYEREEILGKDTKYAQLFRVSKRDLIINKIWARNGAIAVVPTEHDGYFVSTEFPTFEIDESIALSSWIDLRIKMPSFWYECEKASGGTSGKNRIKVEKLLDIEIEVPNTIEQEKIVMNLNKIYQAKNLLEKNLMLLDRIVTKSMEKYE